jgi:ribosomal protein S18 acetylase RimI-like enzyme
LTVLGRQPFSAYEPLAKTRKCCPRSMKSFVDAISEAFQSWATGDQIADIYDLAVAPDEHGHGIGSALMDAVEAELSAAGIAQVRLRVIAANREALSLYEKRGLTPISYVLLGQVRERRAAVRNAAASAES